jgi:hypothetical protein
MCSGRGSFHRKLQFNSIQLSRNSYMFNVTVDAKAQTKDGRVPSRWNRCAVDHARNKCVCEVCTLLTLSLVPRDRKSEQCFCLFAPPTLPRPPSPTRAPSHVSALQCCAVWPQSNTVYGSRYVDSLSARLSFGSHSPHRGSDSGLVKRVVNVALE